MTATPVIGPPLYEAFPAVLTRVDSNSIDVLGEYGPLSLRRGPLGIEGALQIGSEYMVYRTQTAWEIALHYCRRPLGKTIEECTGFADVCSIQPIGKSRVPGTAHGSCPQLLVGVRGTPHGDTTRTPDPKVPSRRAVRGTHGCPAQPFWPYTTQQRLEVVL